MKALAALPTDLERFQRLGAIVFERIQARAEVPKVDSGAADLTQLKRKLNPQVKTCAGLAEGTARSDLGGGS